MALFSAVTDALEDSADGDDRWLDAATSVFDSSSQAMRQEFRLAFEALGESYDLSSSERKRMRRLITSVPPRAELSDLQLPSDQLVKVVLELVQTVVAYDSALDEF